MTAELPRATWARVAGIWVAYCPDCRTRAALPSGYLVAMTEGRPETNGVPERTRHPATGLPWYKVRKRGPGPRRGSPASRDRLFPWSPLRSRSPGAWRQPIILPAVISCACPRDYLVEPLAMELPEA
jgi:hypothetical protein